MKRAISLARRRTGATYPNPCVGAVVVKRGRILGAASSDAAGGDHAEVRALARGGAAVKGATLYVTLEPCAHHGRTPPCVAAIMESGLSTVVIAVRDPAAHVRGRGVTTLRRAGIEVREGVMAAEALEVHAHYLHHVASGRPWISLKIAASLDGRIATAQGDSKWITGEVSRRHAHRLRASHHAVAVGAQTVRADDPRLDVRMARGVNPLPIVFDSRLSLFAGSCALPRLAREGTLFVHTDRASAHALRRLARSGAEGLEVSRDPRGHVDVTMALSRLGDRSIRSILVEGGGRLHGSFVAARRWERLFLYQAPLLLGDGRALLAGVAWDHVQDAPRPRVLARRRLGEDQLIVLAPGDEPAP